MASPKCSQKIGGNTESEKKRSKSLTALAILLMFSVIMYLLLYNFFDLSLRKVSGGTRGNRYPGRHLSLEHSETTERPVIREEDETADGFDLENISGVIGKLSKDIKDIKMQLKKLGFNDSSYDDVSENPESEHALMPESLLTLFATWTRSDEKSTIQKNTLKNWASFRPVVNPVLFTNDSVLAEVAKANGWTTQFISKTAENGLPVLKYMYIDAIKRFDSTFYCYANSDILFDGGLIKTLVHLVYTLGKDLSSRPLFLTGLRWNVINVSEKEISPRKNISALIKRRGKVFITSAEDYFITNKIYPWQDIPEIVVGAIAYDNWLVVNAREKKHVTINTSRTIPALHQSVDGNDHRSHLRDTGNYNGNLLQDIYKINIPYHKGFLQCIEKYTDFVNDTFVVGDRTSNLTMYYNGIRLDVCEDGIAVVTMCNGDNKFTMDYVKTWHRILDEIEKDEKITGLITTGEGKTFSTGLDTEWLKTQSPTTLDEYHDELHRLYKRIVSLGLTTIAVINGHAIAEGAFIALMHDYRVMREDRGWINWPEVHVKLPFTKTMLDLFRVKVPNGVAQREALVFGKRLNADAAKRLGIVDMATKEEDLMTEAKRTLKTAVGKLSLYRGFFNDTKSDLYTSFVCKEKLSAKL